MKHRKIRTGLLIFAALAGMFTAVVFNVLARRTDSLQDDWTILLTDPVYASAVSADGVEPVTQTVSCGYAVIEMFSDWAGGHVTEESLFAENEGVSTSTGAAMETELNRRIPQYTFTRRIYLPDSDLLTAVHDSLAQGIPVPVEWAAQNRDTWTLHYSLITGLDLADDRIEVANPYGYTEVLPIQTFLDRSSFRAFADMPLSYQFGFAFGLFEKNTLFIAEPAS